MDFEKHILRDRTQGNKGEIERRRVACFVSIVAVSNLFDFGHYSQTLLHRIVNQQIPLVEGNTS